MFDSLLMLGHALICVLLVVLILLQRSEGGLGGLGGGGGSNALMGSSSAASGMEKVTKYMFVLFVITSMALSMMSSGSGVSKSVVEGTTAPQAMEKTAPMTAPVPEGVPAAE